MVTSRLLSPVPVGDALAVKEGVSLESVVAILRKLDGRDKATKMMQYGARFFYWWFATTDPALSERAFKLYRTTQRSRKAFRMLKVLDEVVKLRQILRAAGNKADSTGGGGTSAASYLGYAEALMAFRCLAMGAFWTFDNLNYLTTTDTVNFGVARATKGFSRSWSVSSALYILLGIDALRKTGEKRRQALAEYAAAANQQTGFPNGNGSGHPDGYVHGNGSSEALPQHHRGGGLEQGEEESRREAEARLREALTRANAEHFKSWLMILKGALDLTCAVNVSGMDLPKRLLGRKLNDGVIGAAGCASALCVLYNSWPTRQQQEQQQQQRRRPRQQQQREQDERQGQQQQSDSMLPPSPPQHQEKEVSRHVAA
eukprot:g10203.t1